MAAEIETGVSLRTFNTFGVEARAAFFAPVRGVGQLRDALADPRVAGLPRLILGGGSNILFTRDFDGLVVKIDIPGYARIGDDGARWLVRVGAGESWHGTVARLLDDGLHYETRIDERGANEWQRERPLGGQRGLVESVERGQ